MNPQLKRGLLTEILREFLKDNLSVITKILKEGYKKWQTNVKIINEIN